MARTLPPPSAPPTPVTSPPLDWTTWVAIALGVAYVVTYVAIALMRMGYPFELEWMEGSTLGHVDRLLHGQPLYPKPGIDFTPFIYPPLYFTVASWVAKLVGEGFPALRLVSFVASLGCFALIYAYVRAAGGGRGPALLAGCLFAATF